MGQFFNIENIRLLLAIGSFIAILVIIFFVYRTIFRFFRKRVHGTLGKLDYFILDLFKMPALWFIYWILLKSFTHLYLNNLFFFPILLHINSLLFIFSITWITIQFIKAGTYYLQGKYDIGVSDNLNARKSLTQIKVFKGIANTVIIIIAIAFGLLTFNGAKTFGISLLTSAGIFGIIIGFAAQKSLGMILAGIQLAITQPIRLDDVVIVEGEWGRIEEITLTYVVVKIWDERREVLPEMLKKNSDWDGRILNVQVTKLTEQYKEIRILLSSSDASKNWDLRADIREKLINYINENYPKTFAKIRIKSI
jgi:small-conductance mechanosensitive channel